MAVAQFRILAGIFLAILATQAIAASEFQYSIPPGWTDLRAAIVPGSDDHLTDNIPQALMRDAENRQFVVVAVDPVGTTYQRAGATFNAKEAQTTGKLTLDEMKKGAADLVAHFEAAGLPATLVETKVVKLNGVNVGTITIDVESTWGNRRLLQYLITGHKSLTVLSFAAPKADFDRYLPVFEASARATKGGYNHGSFDWERVFVAGGIGGLISVVAGSILAYVRKRRDAEAAIPEGDGEPAIAMATSKAPAASPMRKSSKYTWTCASCGNPVPLRLDQCRCGGAKPA
jgi:hypothetical protein